MRIRPWITTATLLLVATAVCTIGLDGCSDDGTGTIPSSLYSTGTDGSSTDPGVTTQTTPGIPPPPIDDATVDVTTRPDTYRPPKDSSVADTAEAGPDSSDADPDGG
jgi:hypothetical protein